MRSDYDKDPQMFAGVDDDGNGIRVYSENKWVDD
jgi:hypothetical protein